MMINLKDELVLNFRSLDASKGEQGPQGRWRLGSLVAAPAGPALRRGLVLGS